MASFQPPYQGPPPGAPGYDVPVYGPPGFPQAQQAPMTAEEKEAYVRKIRRKKLRDKKRLQDANDAKTTIKWVCGLMTFNSFMLLIPTFGSSWAFAQFTGLGIASLIIKAGVINIDVEFECKKNMLEDKVFGFICNLGKASAGQHTLQHGRTMFCSTAGGMSCNILEKLHHGTFIIFFSYSFAICFSMLGAAFTYYYWFSSPLPKVRQYAVLCMFASPFFAASGLTFWSLYIPDLKGITNHWFNNLAESNNVLAFFSIKEVDQFKFGWCWIFSCVVIFFQFLTIFVHLFFFQRHSGEDAAEAEEARQDEMLENKLLEFEEEQARQMAQMRQGPGAASSSLPEQPGHFGPGAAPFGPGSGDGMWQGQALPGTPAYFGADAQPGLQPGLQPQFR